MRHFFELKKVSESRYDLTNSMVTHSTEIGKILKKLLFGWVEILSRSASFSREKCGIYFEIKPNGTFEKFI